MNDSEPLKPCPFCNTTPILQHTRETGFYIHCPTCQSYTHGVQWSREEALAVWNNRVDPWVRIDPERPETLPPDNGKHVQLSIHISGVNDFDEEYQEDVVIQARYYPHPDVGWCDTFLDPVEVELPDQTVTAVAWQPWSTAYRESTP